MKSKFLKRLIITHLTYKIEREIDELYKRLEKEYKEISYPTNLDSYPTNSDTELYTNEKIKNIVKKIEKTIQENSRKAT